MNRNSYKTLSIRQVQGTGGEKATSVAEIEDNIEILRAQQLAVSVLLTAARTTYLSSLLNSSQAVNTAARAVGTCEG